MARDYKRNGTTTLFAALNVTEGKLIGACMPRHRHQEFIKFLRLMNKEAPAGFCCGDDICEGAENSPNCEVDCGPPPVCGDGLCEPGEDQCSCPSDCCASAPATESAGSDGCDNDCDGLTDSADPDCICGGWGAPCSQNNSCCSNKCKGNGTCK